MLLLAGDNMQMPPPGGTEWVDALVAHVRGDPGTVDEAGRPQSTLGKGLALLRMARRTVLWRIMRAKGDEAFAEAQQRMRKLVRHPARSPSPPASHDMRPRWCASVEPRSPPDRVLSPTES